MKNDKGISPVIAVILLISVTVVLSTAVGIFVLNSSNSSTSEPGRIGYKFNSKTIDDGCEIDVLEIVDLGNSDSLIVQYQSRENRAVSFDSVKAGDEVRLLPNSNITIISELDTKRTVVGNHNTNGKYCGLVTFSSYSSEDDSSGSFFYDVEDMGGSGTVGNSLNEIKVTFDEGSNIFNNVGESDVISVGFDRNNDSQIDVSTIDDLTSVSISNEGRTVQLQFVGNYDVQSGDNIVVKLDDIVNPSSGVYNVTMNINGDVTSTEIEEFD